MAAEFRLPALGADMDDGTIVEWRVKPGDAVKRGDVVAVVETDKGAIDVEIFMDGVVRELLVPTGRNVPVGTALALVDVEGEVAAAAPAPAPAPAPAGAGGGEVPTAAPTPVVEDRGAAHVRISPAARRRARELDVDFTAVRGTGPDGAITIRDIERRAPVPQPAPAKAEDGAKMREAIAASMSRSKREIPHYYLSTTVDVTSVLEWLEQRNAAAPIEERLLFAALLVKAVALACREVAGFSGDYREGRYTEAPDVHVGVAVALRGGGLVAPAIMDTADKSLAVVMGDFRALVTRARAGRLRASELAAPTIILTSLGEGVVDAVLPIIQPPQVAIVGAGAIAERPWVVDGKVVARRVLTLSLAADHRVTDGRIGARFLARIAARLADPGSL
jgi:pyruvate dehydrogenase E2 component (dihydrolipoamide acetyltransferase)